MLAKDEATQVTLAPVALRPSQAAEAKLQTKLILKRTVKEDSSRTRTGPSCALPFHTSGCHPTTCPNQRAHPCQLCLGFRQNNQCCITKRVGKGAGKA